MTMAKNTSSQKDEWEKMMMKRELEFMQRVERAYAGLKPLFELLQKGKSEFGKTVKSREAGNFWETIRTISKEHEQLETEISQPLQDPPKHGETEKKLPEGGRVRANRGQENTENETEFAKRMRKDKEGQADAGNRGGSAGARGVDNKFQRAVDPKSISQGHPGLTRFQRAVDKSISQGHPGLTRENDQTDGNKDLSKTTKKDDNSSPKPVEEVETVSHGSAPITQQDARDLKKIADDRLEQIKLLEKDIGLLTQEKDDLKKRNAQIDQLQNEKRDLKSQINQMEENNNVLTMRHTEACANLKEACANLKKKNEDCEALIETRNEHLKLLLHYENTLKKNEESLEERDRTIRTLGTDLEKLNKEYNDVKSRFSKLAGDKLTDQNPDIADLSDPNRAMKLSEKFGALYDDAWTDAFEYLTDKKKQKPKDAIQYLLECLKECWVLCQKEAATWINTLQHNFLHPVQDTEALSKMQGGKTAVRLGSKDFRVIRDACRKIAPTVGVLVKQCFLMQMKKNQKVTDDLLKYLEGCVDVCWLMVLAEPPLHIDFTIKAGDKFDSNRYVAHSESGETVAFLVWPPLFNALEGGGMLSKGTVSTERKIEKPHKK